MALIDLGNVDFDGFRQSIKDFLKSKPEYSEYEFDLEGPGLAIILDMMAAVGYKIQVYNSMAVNELFLSSSEIRNNIVKRAKELGYTPKSQTAASAYIKFTVLADDNPTSIDLPIYSKFTTKLNDKTYSFFTNKAYNIVDDGFGNYVIDELELVQGKTLTIETEITTENQYIVIPNKNADTSRIKVEVAPTISNPLYAVYDKSTNIIFQDKDTPVYYIEEGLDKNFQIYFGDDIISKKVPIGSIVKITYVVSDGDVINGSRVFSFEGDVGYDVEIDNVIPAAGGSNIEQTQSIKLNAPRFEETQNRLVTQQDYKSLILTGFPQLKSIKVWGGEEHKPPRYGRSVISATMNGNYNLAESLKIQITDEFSKRYRIVGIKPTFVDPSYMYIMISSDVYFERTKTNKTNIELADQLVLDIYDYGKENLNDFDKYFMYSKLTSFIDTRDVSFVNNLTTIKLKHIFEPVFSTTAIEYYLQFNNQLKPNSITSNGFYDGTGRICYIEDSGDGILKQYTYVNSQKVITIQNIGEVDYDTGDLKLNPFSPKSIVSGKYINVIADPLLNNIYSTRNQILVIEKDDISVTMLKEN